jgi:hypothetical protein
LEQRLHSAFRAGSRPILRSFSRRKYMSADEDRQGSNTGTDIGVRFTSIRDLTEFARFHGTPK